MKREPAWRRYLGFWRRGIDAEIETELRFHFEERVADLVARGMTRDEARAQAVDEFGDVEAVRGGLREIDARMERSQVRTEHWARLRQDLAYSARSLRRAPGLSLTIVVTLALGIGINATLFSLLDRVFLRMPSGIAQPEGVHRLYWTVHGPSGSSNAIAQFNVPLFRGVQSSAADLASFTIYRPHQAKLGTFDENGPTALVEYAGPDYFRLLGVRPALGRFFSADEEVIEVPQRVAVVSDAFWRSKLGGRAGVIGSVLEVDKQRYTIVGVAPPAFTGPDLDAVEIWLPLGSFGGFDPPEEGRPPWYRSSTMYAFLVLARPVAGVDLRALETRATVDVRRQFREEHRRDTASTVVTGPVIAARGPERQRQEVAISVRLGGVALIVLLIACANVANLLLARTVQRRREIAVRAALGSGRGGIARLLLSESVLLAFAAGVTALLVSAWSGVLLRTLLLPDVRWGSGALDWRVAAFTVGVALLVGLLAGVAPALQASRPNVANALKAGAREGTSQRSRLRSGLVIVQSALSVMLLAGAALFVRSLRNVKVLDIGFDAPRLTFVMLSFEGGARKAQDAARAASLPVLAERLRGVPGVERVALSSVAPMYSFNFYRVYRQGGDPLPQAADGLPGATAVSADYFATVGLKIVRGRALETPDFAGEPHSVVVNETFARSTWPREEPLGQCVRLREPNASCLTVVGVSEDARRAYVIEESVRQVYIPLRATGDDSPGTVIVRASPPRAAAVALAARREVPRLVPNAEAGIVEMADLMAKQYRPWQLGAALFSVFGLLALVVATVGIYSTVASTVGQRRHEFGVRIALGARAADVLRLVVGGGLKVVAAGVALGALLALAAGRLIATLLYGVTPHDPFVLAAVAFILLAVAAAASALPAWRASRVDPVESLRAD